jgi:hypothetical protein
MTQRIDITRDIFPPMTAESIARTRELAAASMAASKRRACDHIDRFLDVLERVTITDPHHKTLLAHVYAARIDFDNVRSWEAVRDTARELCIVYTSSANSGDKARSRLAAREAVPFN